MFPSLNDQRVAAAQEAEELRWLFALLATKLWVTSFWFGAAWQWRMSSDATWGLMAVITGIQVAKWMLHFFYWLNDMCDWFCLSREKKDMKRLVTQRTELEVALKNVRGQRTKAAKDEAEKADIDLEIQSLESRLVRVNDRIEALEAKGKEAERQKREEQIRVEYDQKRASLTKERVEEVKHRRSRTPVKY